MRTRARELAALRSWIAAHGRPDDDDESASGLLCAINRHLKDVEDTAAGQDVNFIRRGWHTATGSMFERALGNLDAAEVHLLRLAPARILIPALPSIQAHVNRYLAKDDPRRLAVDRIARHHVERLLRDHEASLLPKQWDVLWHELRERVSREQPEMHGQERGTELSEEVREVCISAQHAANSQRRRDLIRLRTFRNLLLAGILALALISIGLGVLGSISPTTIPVCFTPESEGRIKVVCPRAETPLGEINPNRDLDPDPAIARTVTSADLWLVALMGLLGAALTGSAALRNLGNNSAPYAVPATLIAVKLPTGAVSAIVGLQLMRAEFIPGLSALDSSAQILGWAVVFGIAQQLVTQVADNHAAGLLQNIKGRGAGGDRPLKGSEAA